MRKRMIAIALCLVMVSAFAVTGAVSAKHPDVWVVGSNGIVQSRETTAPGVTVNQAYNSDTTHMIHHEHDKNLHEVENVNTYLNNP